MVPLILALAETAAQVVAVVDLQVVQIQVELQHRDKAITEVLQVVVRVQPTAAVVAVVLAQLVALVLILMAVMVELAHLILILAQP
jgi:hypothetical protein